MLMTIDILLGLSVVMLLASMVVTVLAQFLTGLFNTRGRHLLHGLADLLQQIDPNIERDVARKISGAMLMHPLIQDAWGRYGSTIHREEFTKLLLDLASGQIPRRLADQLGTPAQDILKTLLEQNGISEPAKTSEKVRSLALQLELSNPELAGDVRQNIALIREANSHVVAKINTWFDQIIDRVSGRFTFTTHTITVACSILLACTIQLDTIALINRLSVDSDLRNSLVEKAVAIGEKMDAEKTQAEALATLSDQNPNDIKQLMQLGIVTIPKTYSDWQNNWNTVNPLGIAFTVVLLSLGAPFWYNALKNLLKLRSTISGKDDRQREERQTKQEIQSVVE